MKTENFKVVALSAQEQKETSGGGIIDLLIKGLKGKFAPYL
jgi:hypothetical protein